MLTGIILIAIIVVLAVALITLAHFHLLGSKLDSAIANLEIKFQLTNLLTKLNLDDQPTDTTGQK